MAAAATFSLSLADFLAPVFRTLFFLPGCAGLAVSTSKLERQWALAQ